MTSGLEALIGVGLWRGRNGRFGRNRTGKRQVDLPAETRITFKLRSPLALVWHLEIPISCLRFIPSTDLFLVLFAKSTPMRQPPNELLSGKSG